MNPQEAAEKSPAHVQSLVRGLAVIRVFDADNSQQTLSEVARRADLTRATARRVLHTLVDLGYVSSDGKKFSLRPKILELGYAYLSSMSLPAVAQPHLEKLTEATHESSSVAVLDGSDIAYVARVAKQRIMTVAISVGTRFPAYATSMGRVLLAAQPADWLDAYLERIELRPITPRTIVDPDKLKTALTRIAARGYALVDQELEEGLRSLAVPLHDAGGAVVGAMNVSAHASRGSSEAIRKELLPPLLEAAGRVEEDLRGTAGRQAVSR